MERLRLLEEKRQRSYVEWFDMTIDELAGVIAETDLDTHMADLMRQYFKASANTEPNN